MMESPETLLSRVNTLLSMTNPDTFQKDTDEISQDSGTFDIDQSKCLNLNDVAHISNNDLIMCRAHAVAGESNDCTDAVRFSVNSTETATFQCKGTTLDYSCTLN